MTATSAIPLTSSTGTVTGANGLATFTCGPIYIVYQANSSRYLGTVDPATGVITEIGNLGDKVANITFANGVLLGVTGDGASVPETLYSINTVNAAMTLLTPLGNGNDGESIEFNPDDGLLYHWSGWGTASVIMESINPTTFVTNPITLTGATLANVGASTYVGNGKFLISDVNDEGLKYITTSGVVSATSNTTDIFKGMVFPDGSLASVTNTTAANDSICDGETAVLVCHNPGEIYEWFLDGVSTGNTNDTLNATVSGAYVCEVNFGPCTVASDTIHLVVSNLPTVAITPSPSATICEGDTVELLVNTGGGSVQWTLNGTDIPGATSGSLLASSAGSYNAIKTNMNGCTGTAATPTVVNVNPLPSVSLTPSGTVAFCAGDSVEISITMGAGGGNFQWYMDGVAISGATNSTYFASSEGAYNLEKTNTNGCTDSAAVATVLVDTCSNNLFEIEGITFEIYPNPATDFITVDFSSFTNSDLIDLQLVGLDGKAIRVYNISEAHPNGISMNVSDVDAGAYFIRMTTLYGKIVKEIVIE